MPASHSLTVQAYYFLHIVNLQSDGRTIRNDRLLSFVLLTGIALLRMSDSIKVEYEGCLGLPSEEPAHSVIRREYTMTYSGYSHLHGMENIRLVEKFETVITCRITSESAVESVSEIEKVGVV